MNHTAAALTARLDEAFAWLEVHPPTHPGERAVASALAVLRSALDAGLTPTDTAAAAAYLAWTETQTEALAAALPGEDDDLAPLVREIGRHWRELDPGVPTGRRRRRGPSPAPLFVIAGDRPVRSAPAADGGLGVLAYDWGTGRLVRDMSLLDVVTAPGDRDVRVVTVTEFYDTIGALRRRHRLAAPPGPTPVTAAAAVVDWLGTGEAAEPYRAEVDGDEWLIRVNDWPADPTVYTLVVNGRDAFGFDGWPDTWTRP